MADDDRWTPPEPVAVIDAVDHQTWLEHERMRDHRIVLGVGVLLNVEILLNCSAGIRKECPLGSNRRTEFLKSMVIVGGDGGDLSVCHRDLLVERGEFQMLLVLLWAVMAARKCKDSDFKGYEDWAVVSSARTDEVLKVIVGNPTMITAYKAGVPGSGQPFPEGSMIVKLQWKPKKSTEAPFVVDVADVFTQAFVIEKDSKRFRKAAGGDTRCSTTKPHRTSSRPIPKAPQTADTRATRP